MADDMDGLTGSNSVPDNRSLDRDSLTTFLDLLQRRAGHLRVQATGFYQGHVLTVSPKDESSDSSYGFGEILALLGGGLTAASILVFKSIAENSTSQLLGVRSAIPLQSMPQSIGLFGFCLNARRPKPSPNEFYAPTEERPTTTTQIDSFLEISKQAATTAYEYLSLTDHVNEESILAFTQAGIWIITDNIGLPRARELMLKPSVFFSDETLSLFLELMTAVESSGIDVKKTQFRNDIVEVINLNYSLGLLKSSTLRRWNRMYIPLGHAKT